VIVVCGPESSGTRILHRVVTEYIRVDAIHRSMPNAGAWWDWRDFGDRARFVVITRRPDITTQSILARGMAPNAEAHADDWARAMALLAAIPGAIWITYEALLAEPRMQADNIAHWLRRRPTGLMPEIVDNNAKWIAVPA
jgi:hypothetical protein